MYENNNLGSIVAAILSIIMIVVCMKFACDIYNCFESMLESKNE